MAIDSVSALGAASNTSRVTGTTSGASLSINDFFKLIAAQLQNQSMFDSVDNTQFISQLAQFTTLSQINELTSAMNSNLAVSMLGKPVCVTATDELGQTRYVTGEVEQISYQSGVPYLYVNGGYYKLSEVTDVGAASPARESGESGSAEI
jgi:flagellar basal-body rod modification protein FlgD